MSFTDKLRLMNLNSTKEFGNKYNALLYKLSMINGKGKRGGKVKYLLDLNNDTIKITVDENVAVYKINNYNSIQSNPDLTLLSFNGSGSNTKFNKGGNVSSDVIFIAQDEYNGTMDIGFHESEIGDNYYHDGFNKLEDAITSLIKWIRESLDKGVRDSFVRRVPKNKFHIVKCFVDPKTGKSSEIKMFSISAKEAINLYDLGKFEKGGGVSDEDGESYENYLMALGYAKTIKHHSDELLKNMNGEKIKIEPWVLAKLAIVNDGLSVVTHYLDSRYND